MRPVDQEMIAIEKTGCYSQFPGGRGTPQHAGKYQDGSEGRGSKGKV